MFAVVENYEFATLTENMFVLCLNRIARFATTILGNWHTIAIVFCYLFTPYILFNQLNVLLFSAIFSSNFFFLLMEWFSKLIDIRNVSKLIKLKKKIFCSHFFFLSGAQTLLFVQIQSTLEPKPHPWVCIPFVYFPSTQLGIDIVFGIMHSIIKRLFKMICRANVN